MFKKLTEFGYTRTALEAVGFYLAFLGLGVLLGALLGGLGGVFYNNDKYTAMALGLLAGYFVAVVLSVGVAIAVIHQKKLWGNFWYILLIPVTGIIALFFGAMGGLIPVAFLTTRQAKK